MITDKQKKEIIASYVECENYSEVARKYNVSVDTVKRFVTQDKEIVNNLKQKREENTQEVLKAMKERNNKKIEIIDKIFKAMDGKLDNIDMFTNIKDLATAYGIIIDKELRLKELELKEKDNNKQDTVQRIQIINDLPEEVDEIDGTS